MSMTEQEIRADERAKLAKDLEGWQPFLFHPASTGVEFAVRYIRALKPAPAPEPKIGVVWSTHPWDAHTKPAKYWGDVPVTAGMLIQVIDLMESGRTGHARVGLEKLCRAKAGDPA